MIAEVLAAAGGLLVALALLIGAAWCIGVLEITAEDRLEEAAQDAEENNPDAGLELTPLQRELQLVCDSAVEAACDDFLTGSRTSNPWPVGSKQAITWTTTYEPTWMDCELLARLHRLPAAAPLPQRFTRRAAAA